VEQGDTITGVRHENIKHANENGNYKSENSNYEPESMEQTDQDGNDDDEISIENESPDEKMECHMIFYAKKNGFF